MDEKTASKLREQFPPEVVGKLPRVTCPKCANPKKFGQCSDHDKARCGECGNYISTRHIHIDYVGHADVTSRLLEADPDWSWEPHARDIDPAVLAGITDAEVLRMVLESAPPKFDLDEHGDPVGLWIKLTVAGTTRPGYGSCPSGQTDAVKVLIGDALRNAAMRFGVALDLWAKGDRADPTAENATASAGQAARKGRQQQGAGDAWENAAPAPPRSGSGGNRTSRPSGSVSRPAAAQKPAAPADAEVDKDAQQFADEAHEARSLPALRDAWTNASKAKKLAATVADPGTGEKQILSVLVEARRKALAEVETALRELNNAATNMTAADLDEHVKTVTGSDIEGATAEQLRQATEALKAGASA